ncbi:MAG: InlB B-repeat-containing protein [Clostridia bacterium]|nr:InlB B-repeat-containing protein [Clostridia bacterium]
MTYKKQKIHLIIAWVLAIVFSLSTLVLLVKISNVKEDESDNVVTPPSVSDSVVETSVLAVMPFYMSGNEATPYASYTPATLTGQGSNYLNFTDNSGTTGRLHFSSKYSWQDGAVGTIKVQFVASGSNYAVEHSFLANGWNPNEFVVDLVDLYEAGSLKANTEYTVSITFTDVYETESGDYEINQTYTSGTSKKISIVTYGLPDAPIKTGYTFTGWFKDEACTQPYTDSTVIGDVTLYAGFRAHTYSIVFNNNGGSGSIATMSMTYDVAKALTQNTLTRTGYTFKGWSTSSTATTATYTDKQSVKNLTATDNGSVTLYAVWEEHDYTIKFDKNGGTGTMADMSMKYSQTANLTANAFTKTGYTFTGWATSATGSVAKTDKASVSKLTATDGGTITYYAVWQANTYTIKFDGMGGTGTMADVAMTYDQAKTLPANTFVNKGMYFVKWSINGTTSYLTDGASANNLTATANGTVTLKAVWETVTYNFKFHANGGTGTMADQTGVQYDIDTKLSANKFTREHYIFLGWATAANGAVEYADQEEVYGVTENNGSTINLYAVWKLNEKLVTFIADGNTVQSDYVIIGEAAEIPNAPAKTGYNFVGWFLADGTQYVDQEINETTTITARYEIIRCNITFIVDGEVYAYAQVDYGTSILDALTVAGINNFLYEPEGDENF